MTDEEIIELAWQYGDIVTSKGGGGVWEIPNIVGFARAIEQRTLTNQKAKWYQEGVEAEREACAKVCDYTQNHYIRRADKEQMTINQDKVKVAIIVCDQIADRIRARE